MSALYSLAFDSYIFVEQAKSKAKSLEVLRNIADRISIRTGGTHDNVQRTSLPAMFSGIAQSSVLRDPVSGPDR